MLIAHQCFDNCSAATAEHQGCVPNLGPLDSEWTRGWGDPQPEQMFQTDQWDIPYHTILYSAIKAGKKGKVEGICLLKQLLRVWRSCFPGRGISKYFFFLWFCCPAKEEEWWSSLVGTWWPGWANTPQLPSKFFIYLRLIKIFSLFSVIFQVWPQSI